MIITIGQRWRRIGDDLGVNVEVPFKILLKDGASIEVDALVKDFGSKRGMLVTNDFNKIKKHANELIVMGYGYSIISDYSDDDVYDIESYKNVLNDWGWSGDPASKPSWISDP